MKLFFVFVLAFGAGFFTVERTGIFSEYPLSNSEVFYSVPMLSASVLLLIITILSALRNFRKLRINGWVSVVSIMLMVSGLWLSYLTRFSLEVVLTEGQSFSLNRDDYAPDLQYKGRFARTPVFGIKLEKLSPEFSEDGRSIKSLAGKFLYRGEGDNDEKGIEITDGVPEFIGSVLLKIGDFGYSPRYVLKSEKDVTIDSSFVFMRLFPGGSEDYFRLLSPMTYYVRYFPSPDNSKSKPFLKVRIVRNKDIVINRDVMLGEEISYENAKISFEEVKMWTRLSIKRDWGEVLSFIGMIIAFICLVFSFFTMIKKGRINSSDVFFKG
jgi:hypothetical protein